MLEKTCTGPCGRTLPISCFDNEANGKYGVRSDCKSCRKVRHRKAHHANPEKRRTYFRERRKRNGDAVRASERHSRKNAPPKTKEHRHAMAKAWRDNLRSEVITAYGGFCACCGISEICFLTLDHVNQDGAEHRRQIGARHAWSKVYLWARDNGYPPTLRVLCWNCNNAAFRNRGVCPHQESRLALAA